jgi:hypothetical protein
MRQVTPVDWEIVLIPDATQFFAVCGTAANAGLALPFRSKGRG